MRAKPSIAIVGPGRLGTALAIALHRATFNVREIISRDSPPSRRKASSLARRLNAKVLTSRTAYISADVVWLCVPDREINNVANELSGLNNWRGKTCFHSSGALSSDELQSLRDQGANVASVHPLMTFVADSDTPLEGVPFAIEGDAKADRLARSIVRSLGGEAFSVAAHQKPSYHAFGAFISPLLIALLVTAEDVGLAAGLDRASVRKKVAPIVRQTLCNYLEKGPAKAFTGPLVRGDVETVASHLTATKNIPHAAEVYQALARAALARLPVNRKPELEKVLSRARKK